MSESLQLLKKNYLGLRLFPIEPYKLLISEFSPGDVYIYQDEIFQIFLRQGIPVDDEIIIDLYQREIKKVFLDEKSLEVLDRELQEQLIQNSRSLSIGDPLENGTKQINLLTYNLATLYSQPLNDQLLQIQYQGAMNFIRFLIQNKKLLKHFFNNNGVRQHHFCYAQPMLSSILLAAYLLNNHAFNHKEIEMLFLVSYFKDIGISFIPNDSLEKQVLSDEEKDMMKNHAENSVKLLEGRLPFSKSQLNIIFNHHVLNSKLSGTTDSLARQKDLASENLFGTETMLVSVMDALMAMISERPYRSQTSVYEALSKLKNAISEEYPAEFKSLVIFTKNFLS